MAETTLSRPARCRFAGGATITAITIGGLLAVAPPAFAADGDLQVSTDGITYSNGSELPAFPPERRFVPGDAETSSVWVRNAGATPALLRIDLVDPSSDDPDFAAHVDIAATPAGSAVDAISFAAGVAGGSCTVLSGDRVMAPGEAVRVDVVASGSIAFVAGRRRRRDEESPDAS